MVLVNWQGGEGKNIANDAAQEICNDSSKDEQFHYECFTVGCPDIFHPALSFPLALFTYQVLINLKIRLSCENYPGFETV